MTLGGMEVITSLMLTESHERMVWEPCGGGWRKHVLRLVPEPRRDALVMNNRIYIHPAMLPELRLLAAGTKGATPHGD
jgi:hypothetical protein